MELVKKNTVILMGLMNLRNGGLVVGEEMCLGAEVLLSGA
jgi:hypothetical protein